MELVQTLPMDDPLFVGTLLAAGLLPDDTKEELKALPNQASKAGHYLDNVVFSKSLKDRTYLGRLLAVMKKSDYSALNQLCSKIESSLNNASSTLETGASTTPEAGASTIPEPRASTIPEPSASTIPETGAPTSKAD